MKIYTKLIVDIETNEIIAEDSFEYTGALALCGGGKGGGGGDQTITTRYAGYVESRHSEFLNTVAAHRDALIGSSRTGNVGEGSVCGELIKGLYESGQPGGVASGVVDRANLSGRIITSDSPYLSYVNIITEAAFFGTGNLISAFPSLYDMYGKFMAGLDIDALFGQVFEDTVNSPEVANLVSAEAALLDDDIENNVLPRFMAGKRDIGSVNSSAFLTGKAMIEDARVKSISKFSAGLKYGLIPVAADRWGRHLEWNKATVMMYAEIMKLYFSAKMDIEDFNYSMAAKHDLWPFTVLDYERAALGALQGATTMTKDVAGSSGARGAISGALSGAAGGAMIGSAVPGIGTVTGAIVGGVLGLAGSLF